MRLPGSAQVLESRRRRALALVQRGWSLNGVARRIGCAASSVMRWVAAFRRHGQAGVAVRRSPGRPPRLSVAQRGRLLRELLRGPAAHGYGTDLWTTQRIAEVIERKFGVRYHRDHVGRLLAQCGWSCQKPERRVREQGEAAIARRKRPRRPREKRGHFGWGPTSPS